jgi:putative transcriptional regulator
MQDIGGALLDTTAPTPMADDALARTMARLDAAPDSPDLVAPEPAAPDTLMTLLATASGQWRRYGRGVAMVSLQRRDKAPGRDKGLSRLDLARVAPGVSLFKHGHTGFETTIVLQGAFQDGRDDYGVGDFIEVDAGVDHCPRALGTEDCICAIATTWHLKMRGWLGQLVRPLIGM